jgi:SAM-dependent methyltransferase
MHHNSELIFKQHVQSYFKPGLKVLEVGPDMFPSTYQTFVNNSSIDWHTLDLYKSEKLTYVGQEYSFPIPDNTYDIVISGQVIEHVRKIWIWMKELARVCKPGGYVITINPVSFPFHEVPIDCWRIYPDGMRALSDDAGLEVIFSKCETLEMKNCKRDIPGMSVQWYGKLVHGMCRVLGPLGMPVLRSYDTVTVARKPL